MKETTENEGKFVAYYRVSTESQGRSGLGLEAQKKAVLDFLNGGQWELVAEFTEVETGKKAHTVNRPELEHSLKLCKKTRATLVIAKQDRLARNVRFISGLMERGVNCDRPTWTARPTPPQGWTQRARRARPGAGG